MVGNEYSKTIELMQENEILIERRIRELEDKLKTVSFDEEGKLTADFDVESPYYSSARESMDFFRIHMIGSDIEKLKNEKSEYNKKKKEDRELLDIANKLLKEQRDALKRKEKEIYDLSIPFISYNDEEIKEGTSRIESKYEEKKAIQMDIEYLTNQLESLKESIAGFNSQTKRCDELLRALRQERTSLKNKLKDKKEYLNIDEIKKDLESLESSKSYLAFLKETIFNLYTITGFEKKFGLKDTDEYQPEPTTSRSSFPPNPDQTPDLNPPGSEPDRILLPPNPDSDQNLNPDPDQTPDLNPPGSEPGKIPLPPNPDPDQNLNPDQTPESKSFKPMDGFKLDFIEKFGYTPGAKEREWNKDYRGDYNSLVSKEPSLRERIITRIRNIPSSVSNSIRRTPNKNFKDRKPVVLVSAEEYNKKGKWKGRV